MMTEYIDDVIAQHQHLSAMALSVSAIATNEAKPPRPSSKRTPNHINEDTASHGKEHTPPQGHGLALSIDELAIPILAPTKKTAIDAEQPTRQVRKWKLKHHASVQKQLTIDQEIHAAAAMRHEPCLPPLSPPATISSSKTMPDILAKTTAPAAPSTHQCYLKSPSLLHSKTMELDEDTIIAMPSCCYALHLKRRPSVMIKNAFCQDDPRSRCAVDL